MPNGNHMAPNQREGESRCICEHIVYLWQQFKHSVPRWIEGGANNIYGIPHRLEEATEMLRTRCRCLTQEESDKYIYDGKNPKARRLADWWDQEQERTQTRLTKEQVERKRLSLQKSALAKLTPAAKEDEAMGESFAADEWISVLDRLPPEGVVVNADCQETYAGLQSSVLRLLIRRGETWCRPSGAVHPYTPTHWKPREERRMADRSLGFRGCCCIAGVKYIHEDGTIDEHRYLQAVNRHLLEPREHAPADYCRCACHQDGKVCLC